MKYFHDSILGTSIFLVVLLLLSPSVHGENFPVTDQASFQAALTAAAANGQADTITIPPSTTIVVTTTLAYPWPANENYPLTIEGSGPTSSVIQGDPAFSGYYGMLYIDHPNPAGTYPYPDVDADVIVRNIGFSGGQGGTVGGAYLSGYDADFTVEGCTFSGNSAVDDGWGQAGGLIVWSARGLVTASGNTFQNNEVESAGYSGAAGAYLYGYQTGIVVENNQFLNNQILYDYNGDNYVAGGLYTETGATLTMTNNTFTSNNVIDHSGSADAAGGAYISSGDPANLTGNTFTDNSAYSGSGGLDISVTNAVLTDNTFTNNTGDPTYSYGGGAHIFASAQATLTGNSFTGNSAHEGGAAEVYSPSIIMVNNVVSGNTASTSNPLGAGGGLRISAIGSLTMTNNTLTGNTATSSNGGGLYIRTFPATTALNIYNNIIWGNSATGTGDDIRLDNATGGTATISHSDYGDLSFETAPTLVSNISGAPVWTADFHLLYGSPGIDVGNNAAPSIPATDRDGNPRIDGGTVDMGAYEFVSTAALTTAASPPAGGSVTPPSGTVDIGTPIAISAAPNAGYRFDGWSASPPASASFEDANRSSTTVTITGAVTVTAAFAAVADGDGDGIDDAVDGTWDGASFTDESGTSSNNFTDEHTGGTTSGTITDRSDLNVTVVESPDPTGLLVGAGGGSGTAVVSVSGIDHDFTDGDSAIVTVGSLTTDVLTGPVEIHLAVDLFLIVPGGTKAVITVNPTDFLVECQGTASITVDKGGTQTAIDPGESQTVASDFADLTMTENPDAGGDTTPSPGTTTVDRAVAQAISTTVNAGYFFTGWTADPAGNAVFDNSAAPSTNVTLSGDATVTAHYTQSLTLTVILAGTGTGTVTGDTTGVEGDGISCGANCSESYASGTVVNLTPSPATGSSFSGWSGDADCADGSVTMTTHISCTANFTLNQYTVTANADGTGIGTMVSSAGGINYSYQGTSTDTTIPLDYGTIITLTATAGTESTVAWSDCTGGVIGGDSATATCTFSSLSADRTVTATYTLNQYTVTPSAGTGGSLTPGTPQTVDYNATTAFTVTPSTGYSINTVAGCGGSLAGSIFTTGPVTADCTVTATFTLNQYTVTPSAGTGGSLTPGTPQLVDYNTTTTFTVTPNTGYHVDSVAGCGGSLAGSIFTTGPVTADCTVTATFALNTFALSVTKTGTGFGTITGTPAGIDCGVDCTENYTPGTAVTLTPTPSLRSFFTGWSGDADCADGEVTLTEDTSCTAAFDAMGDWNGDGTPDMAWHNPETGNNALLYLNGNARAGIDFIVTSPAGWEMAAAADLNDDGLMDLIWRNRISGIHVVSYFDGKDLLSINPIPFKRTPWELCGTGDHNNDGKVDLFWTNGETGENEVSYVSAGSEIGTDSLPKAPPPWKVVAIDDFNADGVLDLLARNTATGMMAVGYLNGTSLAGIDILPKAPLSQEICGTMDLNLDGKPDILLRDPATGKNEAWYMDGTKRTETVNLPTAPPPWSGKTGYK